jgi:hypothetical protein
MKVAIHNYMREERKYSPCWTYSMNEKGKVKTSDTLVMNMLYKVGVFFHRSDDGRSTSVWRGWLAM